MPQLEPTATFTRYDNFEDVNISTDDHAVRYFFGAMKTSIWMLETVRKRSWRWASMRSDHIPGGDTFVCWASLCVEYMEKKICLCYVTSRSMSPSSKKQFINWGTAGCSPKPYCGSRKTRRVYNISPRLWTKNEQIVDSDKDFTTDLDGSDRFIQLLLRTCITVWFVFSCGISKYHYARRDSWMVPHVSYFTCNPLLFWALHIYSRNERVGILVRTRL